MIDDTRFELAHLCDGRGVSWIVSSRESRAMSAGSEQFFIFIPWKTSGSIAPPRRLEAALRVLSTPLHQCLLPSLLWA